MKPARVSRLAALMAGVAALLPLAASGPTANAATAPAPAAFDPPHARLLLTRTLHSPLANGREIVSTRTFEIAIVRDGAGWRVDGRQVAASVEAPPSLRALAQIEERADDSAQFPIRLDARGLIQPAERGLGVPARSSAIAPARDYASARQADPAALSAALGFVSQMQGQRVLSAWPADLFRPAPGHSANSTEVTLPDGRRGTVTVEGNARLGGDGGILSVLERVVTTSLGESRRTLREEWTLRLAAD